MAERADDARKTGIRERGSRSRNTPEGARFAGAGAPSSNPGSGSRGPLETLTLAGLGALALAAQRGDDLADEVAKRVGVEREEMRAAFADALQSWLREARRVGESTGDAAARIGAELGIASRDVVDDLELRVAQLEHRLKLLER
jgi:polyhydroxyalkanoate synthesis regulator phasin